MSRLCFLASSEDCALRIPRKCTLVGRAETTNGRGLWLARVDPPLPAAEFGLDEDVADVVLTARHQGVSLFPIADWPAFVHLLLPKEANVNASLPIAVADLILVTWAELYPTEHEATAAMRRVYGAPQSSSPESTP